MQGILTYFTFQDKTSFIPLRQLYPECFILLKDSPDAMPMQCMRGPCSKNAQCMEILAKRVYYFFNEIDPTSEMLIVYYKYNTSLKGVIFDKEMNEPVLKTLNPSGFNKFKNEGDIKQWPMRPEFLNIGGYYKTDNIIPVENLIK